MLSKLCSGGQPLSITQLTEGSDLSRQAISKHLRVLEVAGVVRSLRIGREHQYAFEPEPIRDVKKYLERASDQWDDALARLKAFVERGSALGRGGVRQPRPNNHL